MKLTTDLDAITADLRTNFDTLRRELTAHYTTPITADAEQALAWVETFAAISMRLMRRTNPSKIRDVARSEEIKAYMDGRQVMKD